MSRSWGTVVARARSELDAVGGSALRARGGAALVAAAQQAAGGGGESRGEARGTRSAWSSGSGVMKGGLDQV